MTEYISLCSWLILRDHKPDNICFKGSGLPIPVTGASWIFFIRSLIRSYFFNIVFFPIR
ncbi:hypothetical protein BTU51_0154 [Rickettsia rickettsii]|uniref:Uncharacterized protein n=1 Tax=Rickettsia rickettsii (strain Iowa) TaxID=452659 RepID=B0BW47_RICRO|nr:hypothetical protein RrIowa_0154 [Rickettsia rickettsii str. Iowa]APU55025.1 hypothetical protein BTU50_0154 [Rickettsia rickettsii]APU56402.1 hypothetical protein BTU51_0154 [Rickettsia rickettsii]